MNGNESYGAGCILYTRPSTAVNTVLLELLTVRLRHPYDGTRTTVLYGDDTRQTKDTYTRSISINNRAVVTERPRYSILIHDVAAFHSISPSEHASEAVRRISSEVGHSIGLGNDFQWSIILNFDDGRTSILDPEITPEIRCNVSGPSAKIPTVLYYDQSGDLKAAGAEALDENVVRSAEAEGWVKYSRFKPHLCRKWAFIEEISEQIVPLPSGKDVVEVFGDFYAYLVKCTLSHVQDSHPSGASFLSCVQDHIEYIISYPNGWDGIQEEKLRRAAVYAGLIYDNDKDHERIHFMAEVEAILHFCIDRGLFPLLRDREGVMVVDAGRRTVDISTYTRTSSGSTNEKLRGSQYEGEVELIAKCFGETTMRRFGPGNADGPAFIQFGSMRDRDPQVDIRNGRLRLAGSDVASFFEPEVSSILREIDNHRISAKVFVSSIFLVGSFAANDWLFQRIREHVEPSGVSVARPEGDMDKAVADGAVSFYIHNILFESLLVRELQEQVRALLKEKEELKQELLGTREALTREQEEVRRLRNARAEVDTWYRSGRRICQDEM
ncbi:hypothetical protein ARMSODRAFT_1006573 [Armillaria solidipes]|uniref:Actin-like ATPase domain-containing protein n=1 Tax=Armillaria solidipes TaxID=1076256 RepID=A0A2H3BLI6_9AGAR|nr:hypothetical protein ARMSODRAFT_1006573 [Armillaria solidipes]